MALSRSGVIAWVATSAADAGAADALPAERGAVEPVVDRDGAVASARVVDGDEGGDAAVRRGELRPLARRGAARLAAAAEVDRQEAKRSGALGHGSERSHEAGERPAVGLGQRVLPARARAMRRAADLLRDGARELTRLGLAAAAEHGARHRGAEQRDEKDQPGLLDRRGASCLDACRDARRAGRAGGALKCAELGETLARFAHEGDCFREDDPDRVADLHRLLVQVP